MQGNLYFLFHWLLVQCHIWDKNNGKPYSLRNCCRNQKCLGADIIFGYQKEHHRAERLALDVLKCRLDLRLEAMEELLITSLFCFVLFFDCILGEPANCAVNCSKD